VNPDGNERLTAVVGVLLLAPVLVEVATVLLGVHTFMSWHVFVGLALIPVVVLKLLSTGWRFVRYYTRSRDYVAHGPPRTAMRLLAPLFVVVTVVLLGSGVAMGFVHGQALQTARRLHGPASVIWLLLLGVHVLVYLGRALRKTADDVMPAERASVPGKTARLYALATAVVCGLLLGAVLVPAQHRWVDLPRDHHDRRDGYTPAATTVSAPSTRIVGAPSTRRSRPSAARLDVCTNAATHTIPAARASVSRSLTSCVPMP
jgi:hypothetical protein